MLIDWFTVIAQVINFLILVALLKHFLYQPILNAINAREQRIAAQIAEAEEKKAQALKELEQFKRNNEDFDKQRKARMDEVIDEANQERERLLDRARQEADNLRVRLQSELKNDQKMLSETLINRIQEEVLAITRKVLTDLAGTTLEARMTEVLLERLKALNNTALDELKSAFSSSSEPLCVRTSFTLSEQQCGTIETLLKELLGQQTIVQFERAEDLICGIEISANGQKIEWSIADYLDSLQKSIDSMLKTQLNTGFLNKVDSHRMHNNEQSI
ncbi:MAG TPA: F0F1 ATP synthase subunit B [Gammaproteobacteria bacterium]|nr:F0F1 ATP synthase subunit B [Gammaproteobacteria bacterium]